MIRQTQSSRGAQQGFVLVTALILLAILGLLGVVAMRGSLFAERISANDRDLAIARESAELALRDAERDILGKRFDGSFCGSGAGCRTTGTRPVTAADSLNFWTTDVVNELAPNDMPAPNGGSGRMVGMFSAEAQQQCGKPIWNGADWNDGVTRVCAGTLTAALPTVEYGAFTGATLPAADVRNPRYIVEMFRAAEFGVGESKRIFFRITAVGFGRTQVLGGNPVSITLQSVFSPL